MCKYEGFIEKICVKMTNDLFHSIFSGQLEDNIMNMRLDFVILSLRLIDMLVETKVRLEEEILKKNVFAFTKEYFYESLVLFNIATDLENDLVFIFKTVFMIDSIVTGSQQSQ